MSETEHEQHDGTTFEAPEQPDDQPDEEEEAAEHEHATEGGPSEADEQPPDQPQSERDLDKLRDKLDREATRHANRVSEVMGEDAQLLVKCELCEPGMPGFHWPADVQQAYSPLHGRLLEVLRTPEGPDYRRAPHAVTCEACDGYGRVLSGSKMPEHRLVACPDCGALGYIAAGAGRANGSAVEQPALVPVAASGEPMVLDDTDAFGSPRLLADGQQNPNYGKMIQYKDPNLP